MPFDPIKIAKKMTVVDYAAAIVCTIVGVVMLAFTAGTAGWLWLAGGAVGFVLARLKPALWMINKLKGAVVKHQRHQRHA